MSGATEENMSVMSRANAKFTEWRVIWDKHRLTDKSLVLARVVRSSLSLFSPFFLRVALSCCSAHLDTVAPSTALVRSRNPALLSPVLDHYRTVDCDPLSTRNLQAHLLILLEPSIHWVGNLVRGVMLCCSTAASSLLSR